MWNVIDKNWNGQTSQLIVSSAETTATLRGLTPVTSYYIRVIAENAIGRSEPSEVIEVTTEEEGTITIYTFLWILNFFNISNF